MSRSSIAPDVRRQLVILCRKPEYRTNPPQINLANRWLPRTVREPITMSLYTDVGAWELIAECIEAGADVNHKPKSEKFPDDAYELCSAPQGGDRNIYMKIAIRPGLRKLIGVSFHYDQLA